MKIQCASNRVFGTSPLLTEMPELFEPFQACTLTVEIDKTTTHPGAYTLDSLHCTAEVAVRSIVECLDGTKPAGLINTEVWDEN